MPKITVDKFHDKEAVLDADRPEDSDLLHKLEVNELSRNSVCIVQIQNYYCLCHVLLKMYLILGQSVIRDSLLQRWDSQNRYGSCL